MKIALIDTTKIFGNRSINKDLNGSYGTKDNFGNSLYGRLFQNLRGQAVFLPHLTSIYIYTILEKKGYSVKYFYKNKPNDYFDIFIIVGSIVDYKKENEIAGELKTRFKTSRVGFIGPFPAKMPNLFSNSDFIIDGEAEAFFLYQFHSIEELDGIIKVNRWIDMDDLPSPNYSAFPINQYKYRPILNKGPILTIQSSRGCPYSCGYYCTYPTSQGKKVRQRSVKSLVEDIAFMQNKFLMRSLLFRDPIFGIDKEYPFLLSEEIIKKNISIDWGIETRADLLTKNNLLLMKKAGLKSVNIGIETNNADIAKLNKRKLSEAAHQAEIINYCRKLGIKVIGFFIFGLEGDTTNSIEKTIQFSLEQNIFMARFSVSTPYPGTAYYESLKQNNSLLDKEFEEYNQFNMTISQDNLTEEEIDKSIVSAYKRFYMRPKKVMSLFIDQVMSVIA